MTCVPVSSERWHAQFVPYAFCGIIAETGRVSNPGQSSKIPCCISREIEDTRTHPKTFFQVHVREAQGSAKFFDQGVGMATTILDSVTQSVTPSMAEQFGKMLGMEPGQVMPGINMAAP